MKVGAILPTVKDKKGKWLEWFIKQAIPSMRFLRGLDIKLLINFQNYSIGEISDILKLINKYYQTDIEYSNIDYIPPVSMSEIREKIAELDPSCDYFLCLDDDVVFGRKSTAKYRSVLDYLSTSQCGALMCMGYRGGKNFGHDIVETNTGMWWTNRGLFLKNLPETDWLFCPHDVLGLPGPLEETYAIYSRFQLGYHAAKVYNFDTKHKVSRVDNPKDFLLHAQKKGRYDIDTDIHNPRFDGILQTIRRKWADPTWTYMRLDMPKKLHNEYTTNGGKNLSSKNIVPVTLSNTLPFDF